MQVYKRFFINFEDVFDREEVEELPQDKQYIMCFDQATNRTGFSIFSTEGLLHGYGLIIRDQNEDPTEYKVKMKNYVKDFMRKYKVVELVHEDTYGGFNYAAQKRLNTILTSFAEIKYEEFPDVKVTSYINTEWKKYLLYPESIGRSTKEHKEKVKKKILETYPCMDREKEDIYDAIGIGLAHFKTKNNDNGLASHKIKKPNQRIAVEYELHQVLPDEIANVDPTNPELVMYGKKHGIALKNYNEKLSLEDNIRVATEDDDSLIMFIIPDHRYYGTILLKNNLKYEPDKVLICYAKRKSAK